MNSPRIACRYSMLTAVLLTAVGPFANMAARADETARSPTAKETAAHRDERMQWFRDARFGMFLHWGLYSIPGGVYKNQTGHAEWYIETTHMPTSEYEKFADQEGVREARHRIGHT